MTYPIPTDNTRSCEIAQLDRLADSLHRVLFDDYLPFWDRGGIDKENGGFFCELASNGSPLRDVKHIWYQGRGVWAYAFLYQYIDRSDQWMRTARRAADFMLAHMQVGLGRWHELVSGTGVSIRGPRDLIYDSLCAAEGLLALAVSSGNHDTLPLIKGSIIHAAKRYNNCSYAGAERSGCRTLGHAMNLLWVSSRYLESFADPEIAEICEENRTAIAEKFYNPDCDVTNPFLTFQYARLPGEEAVGQLGLTLQATWMLAFEARRIGCHKLVTHACGHFERTIRHAWDSQYGGLCAGEYHAAKAEATAGGAVFALKPMWVHCEALIGSLLLYECEAKPAGLEWFEKVWSYLRHFHEPGTGIWCQAVDQRGRPCPRPGIELGRRDNYHPPRALMLCLLGLARVRQRMRCRIGG